MSLPSQWSKRLLYTGDTFTGRFAEKIGFALEAVPAEQLDDHVLALATRIGAMGRDIVAINKHVLNRGIDLMGQRQRAHDGQHESGCSDATHAPG